MTDLIAKAEALPPLKPFGYAPGNYMNECHVCKTVVIDLDKRAITCRPCAEKAFAAAEQPAEPVALEVRLGNMHESNGRVTWVVILCRAGDSVFGGYQIYADTIKGRAEYEAAALKHLLGQGPKPDLLAFDTEPPAAVRPDPRIAQLSADLAAAQAVLPCGHHHSLMLKSAETGEPLYCELCDCISSRNDFQTERDEARAQNERDAEFIKQIGDTCARAEAEVAALRADAERYEHCRNAQTAAWMGLDPHDPDVLVKLDAAIDQARGAAHD